MNIVDRVKNILITPNTEWRKIEAEPPNIQTILTTYVLPLLLIGAVATLIGYGLIGYGFLGRGTIVIGLISAVLYVVTAVVNVFVVAGAIEILAPTFESEKNWNRSFQLAAYSLTASYVGAVFYIIPVLSILAALCGLYSLYILYTGIPVIKKTAADKQIGYLAVVVLITIVAYILVGVIQAAILRTLFFGPRFL